MPTLSNETIFWVLVVVTIIALADGVVLFFLFHKIKQLLGGTSAKDIESSLVLIRKEIDGLKTFRIDVERYLKTVEFRLKRSVQSIETIRFNPFKGTGDGGNQSFTTALVDERGDGVVVSGLYSRDRISVFSKPLKAYKSEFELTEEENEVLESSKKKITSRA